VTSTPPDDAAARTPDAEQSAQEAVQPDRLLPGEDERTRFPEDATHWIKVYSELLGFKRQVLTVTVERMAAMGHEAAHEVRETDLKILVAEEERLERRLTLWRRRRAELREEPLPGADEDLLEFGGAE
jgi:hypothetical protein